MRSLLDLSYICHFHTLPGALYSPVQPKGLHNPKLVVSSEACGHLIGLDVETLKEADFLNVISGRALLSPWQPIAMKYTGHQFGQYNPELGDGRGLLLAQVIKDNAIWDLHLKGAGLTPYSRQGDGRAVLRSSIREFLASEAMAALNIPTSRALCIVDSDETVFREQPETGAMIMRVSKSHIRFGHFEFCSFSNQAELLKTLCNFVIDQHYPDLNQHENPYEEFYSRTVEATAKLMAQWQSVGFAHGVMNTDNMSILGDTFDYGPFAFLDDYEPNFVCNHSDHQGRYAFNQQPIIAHWNLSVLAQALLPLIDKDLLIGHLDAFPKHFSTHFYSIMAKKLGLMGEGERHQNTIDTTLKMLEACKLDYSYFFRALSDIQLDNGHTQLRNHCLDISAFDQWYDIYTQALVANGQSEGTNTTAERKARMNLVNPKYILRNYLAQNAIEAAQNGDYSKVNELHEVLKKPFDEQPEFEEYAALPPDWSKKIEISCSS